MIKKNNKKARKYECPSDSSSASFFKKEGGNVFMSGDDDEVGLCFQNWDKQERRSSSESSEHKSEFKQTNTSLIDGNIYFNKFKIFIRIFNMKSILQQFYIHCIYKLYLHIKMI